MGEVSSVLNRLLALEARINELNGAILFTMQATMIRMTVATGMLDSRGQPIGRAVEGTMLSFYQKALEHGKNALHELTIEDFADATTQESNPSSEPGPVRPAITITD